MWDNSKFKAYYLHLDFMGVVRVLDRSQNTIKDYWRSSKVLKGINNINIAWEEVSVKCLNGDWRKYLPPFMNEFTGFGLVENSIDVSSQAQPAKLDEIRAEGITQLLDSHEQQLFNKYLEEMV